MFHPERFGQTNADLENVNATEVEDDEFEAVESGLDEYDGKGDRGLSEETGKGKKKIDRAVNQTIFFSPDSAKIYLHWGIRSEKGGQIAQLFLSTTMTHK